MANDQLEVIAPNGEIKFFDLNPGRGITNIGRHPENDLVIDSTDVALFHAVLDHRQRPYQLVVVSQESETVIEGQRVQPNVPHVLQTWDTIQLNGHSIILIEGDGGMSSGGRGYARADAAAPTLALAATAAAAATVAGAAAATPAPTSATGLVYPRLATPPAERADEFVVTEITEREWMIDVEGIANTQLTVANGGDLVATFQVHVDGVDPAWVTVEPVSVNLFEGERATFSISITPPRAPTSRAGTYYLSLITASPDYPTKSSAHTCTLALNPYYDYSLSDLSPKQQSVTFNHQTARTALALANRGNSDCTYRLDAEDDERGCHFDFQVPGDEGALLGHAEVRLAPDTAITVPLRATPNKRRFFGVGKHHYLYTITATPLAGAQSPRARQGQLSAAPLVGPWLIILAVVLLALLFAWIFRPHINYFGTDPNLLREDGTLQRTAGETVVLNWSASPWTRLTVESTLAQDPDAGAVPGGQGTKTFAPIDDVNYTLRGENLLTSLFPSFFSDHKSITVKVAGVEPGMYFTGTVSSGFVGFDVRTNTLTIVKGGTVVLSWNVVRTDDLFLLTNGAAQSIAPEQYTSSLTVAPEIESVYQLRALNFYTGAEGKISSPITVKVLEASPTPPPVPVIQRFDVQPLVITAGESIRLDWVVTGVDQVTILGVDGVYAPTGSIEFTPPAAGTFSFVLTAQWAGEPKTLQQIVTVLPAPSPTPEPLAPKIDFFTVSPDEVVAGDPEASDITLAWSVSGATTNIEISGPAFGTVSNLNKQGSITVAVEKPTLLVITAFNGPDLSTSATVQINVLPPTPTPTPPPTATPAPTPLPLPIVIFSAAGDPDHGEPSNSVIALTGSDVPSNTRRYQVVAGTWVKFSWNATNAVKTIFDGEDKAPVDSVSTQINVADTILFSAINAQGYQTDLFIQVVTTPRPAPPPPFNVIGAFDGGAGTVTLRWDYSNSAVANIDHFKVYRATLPDTTFVPYADNIPKTIPYQWIDTAASCNMAYYVVAVYTEIGGGIRETGPSSNSWYSPACPTPTPEP